MSPTTHVVCGGLPDPAVGPDKAPLRLDRRAGGNITLSQEHLHATLQGPIPPGMLDLLDVATYVYVADQAVRRVPRPGRRGSDDGWRRSFHFHVPLREPGRWADPAVAAELADVVGFLSDDDYEFSFTPFTDPPDRQPRLPFAVGPGGVAVDEVALFSGGLDSLAGAAELVAAGRRPLLVTHRPCDKLAARQDRLLAGLADLAGGRRPAHLPVEVNKDDELGVEFTQRSRSFLFAALGGLAAATVGLDRLRFYENGVVSLNLPPGGAVVGGRATRTTHPRVLAGFARLLTVAAGRPFAVENPFRDRTKAEVVRALAAAGGRGLIRWSTSCVHTRGWTNAAPHCGRCSQCVDRRFATLAAGCGADDPADAYGVDLLTGEREAEDAGLLAGYVEQATELGEMADPLAFFARYGEAMRAVRAGPEPPEAAGRRVYALYRRHAAGVNAVVDQAVRGHAAGIRTRSLPPTCLVRLVSDGGAVVHADAAPPPADDYVFRRRGEGWEVWFRGDESLFLAPQRGMDYLHHLLARPYLAADVVELAGGVAGESEQTRTDREGLATLHRRLVELNADLDRGRADNDAARVADAEAEREQVLAQVKADTARGGRLRKVADGVERARKAVGMAVGRAVQKIAEYDPALAAHLAEPHLSLGAAPVYRPPDGVAWRTD